MDVIVFRYAYERMSRGMDGEVVLANPFVVRRRGLQRCAMSFPRWTFAHTKRHSRKRKRKKAHPRSGKLASFIGTNNGFEFNRVQPMVPDNKPGSARSECLRRCHVDTSHVTVEFGEFVESKERCLGRREGGLSGAEWQACKTLRSTVCGGVWAV